jgi:hypothetical protein
VGRTVDPVRAVGATWTGGPSVTATPVEGAAAVDADADLHHVDCAGPSWCLAQSGSAEAARFDGAGWRTAAQPPDSVALADSGVACASAGRCFLVFSAPSPPGGESLWESDGVTATAVVVAGADQLTPSAAFTDVSCPTATACLAVGTYRSGELTRASVARFDGTTWTPLPDVPVPAGASADAPRIDCGAPAACVAVMTARRAVAEPELVVATWDGTAWRTGALSSVPSGSGVVPVDVACGGPASCVVVARRGSPRGRIAERWDGTRWTALPPPLAEEENPLFPGRSRLSCGAPASCALLTATVLTPGGSVTRVQRWDGTSWSFTPEPVPPVGGTEPGGLADIDCTAADACIAVGTGFAVDAPPGEARFWGLAATWDGTSWTSRQVTYGGSALALRAVSCVSADRCLAVNDGTAVAARTVFGAAGGRRGWAGTTSPPVGPDAGWTVHATAVSCAGDWCLVVGDDQRLDASRPAALRYRL